MAPRKIGKWEFTEKEIQEQLDRSARLGEAEKERPASRLEFSSDGKQIILYFSDGFVMGFPSFDIRELRSARPKEIRQGYLTASGDAIHWDDLDAHYTVIGLLMGRFGSREWMREIAKKGGSKTSEAKKIAAQINGSKGGRPRHTHAVSFSLAKSSSSSGLIKKRTASRSGRKASTAKVKPKVSGVKASSKSTHRSKQSRKIR